MSIPACRYIGSFSSWYWIPPATFPSISTTSSTAESSPRSSSSITSTGSGSAHQRDTDGSARIARSFFASPRRPGLSVTLRPTRMGCDPAWSSSDVVTGTRYSRVAGTLDDVALVYLVQHGEKEPLPGDPGLTRSGQEQGSCSLQPHPAHWRLHGADPAPGRTATMSHRSGYDRHDVASWRLAMGQPEPRRPRVSQLHQRARHAAARHRLAAACHGLKGTL